MLTSKLESDSVRRIDISYKTHCRVYLKSTDKCLGQVRFDIPLEYPVARHLGNWIVEAKGTKIVLSPANEDRETESIELIGCERNSAMVYYSSEDGKEKTETYILDRNVIISLKRRFSNIHDHSLRADQSKSIIREQHSENTEIHGDLSGTGFKVETGDHKTFTQSNMIGSEEEHNDSYRGKYEKERKRNEALQDLLTEKIEQAIRNNQQSSSFLSRKNKEMIEVLMREEDNIKALEAESEQFQNKLIKTREEKQNLEKSIAEITDEIKKYKIEVDGLERIKSISLEGCLKVRKKIEDIRVRIQLDEQVLRTMAQGSLFDDIEKLQMISDDLEEIENKICAFIKMKETY